MIRRARIEDFDQIISLQKKNYKDNLSEEEKLKEGFISILYTNDELLEISKEGLLVAEDDKKIVGLMMPLIPSHAKKVPLLKPFIKKFNDYEYNSKKLSSYNWVIAGQVLIDKNFKGLGLAESLWKEFVKLMKTKGYDIILSEISQNNPRSLHVATTKFGFKVLKKYSANGYDWYFIYYPL